MSRHSHATLAILVLLSIAGCATGPAPAPTMRPDTTAVAPAPAPPRPTRKICVVRGRLRSFSSAYLDAHASRPLFGMFGTQLVDRASPPREFGGRVVAILRWPVVGPTWIGSERFISLTGPLAIPEMGITVMARRYLKETKQLDDGRVTLRLDLGKGATPRYLERTVTCEQLVLGSFVPLKPIDPNAPKLEYAVFSEGRDPKPTPLSLTPGGPPAVTLGLRSSEVIGKQGDWVQIKGKRGAFSYSGWVAKGAATKLSNQAMGGLGILGTLRGGKGSPPPVWMDTTRPMPMRLSADPNAPIIATLATRVRVRELRRENGFVWIAIGAMRRSDSPQVDHKQNRGFAVAEADFAVTPIAK
jgi:hypothetical protein